MPSLRLELWTLAGFICLELNLIYKFLFWTVEQAAYTKYQYDPNTIIYNQPSKMQEVEQTQPARHQSMKPMLSFTYYVRYDGTIHKYFKILFNLYFYLILYYTIWLI